MIAVCVDDLILITETEDEIFRVKKDLKVKFQMKDMGQLHYCLGINIERDNKEGVLWIHQHMFILNMIRKYGQMDPNPILIPGDINVKLEKNDGVSKEVDPKAYQSMVGSLLFAAMATRPDIAQTVGVVSKFCSKPSEAHLTAVKRIFRYLKETATFGLKYKCSGQQALVGFSDADWAGDMDDRHSTSGNIFMMAGWLSKKQCVVALSSTEAEYIALCSATQEAVWLRRLLGDLSGEVSKPTVIMEDNQGAIALAQNPITHARTKHIDICHHFVREAIQDGIISLQYCHTKEMVADALTKVLARAQFQKLRGLMGVINCKSSGSVKSVNALM